MSQHVWPSSSRPAAVVAEVALLRELGRISIGIAELKTTLDEVPSFRFLPLDLDQLEDFAALSGIREPFDRLILAAARTVNARLITKDSRLEGVEARSHGLALETAQISLPLGAAASVMTQIAKKQLQGARHERAPKRIAPIEIPPAA